MYSPNNHVSGKRENKKYLQKKLGLIQDDNAPLFFWPSRLDNIQKGCDLFAEIIYDIMSAYWSSNLQVVFVADGEYKKHFYDIMVHHGFDDRIALCGFDEELERLAYAASDFILMPSKFEPCGLPQMVGSIYGALPLVHDTGGLHDTVTELDVEKNQGNGFLFENYNSTGFRWSIDQAMKFHTFPAAVKNKNRKRIMKESREKFTHKVTAKQYIDLYEKMLERPFIN
jgi:starch synthase/alpha-amylase